MGWNDHMEDSELANLPPEALLPFHDPIEFDDHWLKRAERDDQRIAVYEWFKARYCDPAMETPYAGREDGYIFINGGPFDPADVIPVRFLGIVGEDVIDEVVDELYGETGDAWAPIIHQGEPDFDPSLVFAFEPSDKPLMRLRQRIEHGYRVLSLGGDISAKAMAEQLVYSSIITSLEAFLWETVDHWVRNDQEVLRNIVTKHKALSDQPLKLGEIFDKHTGIDTLVIGFLQRVLWHRIDDVGRIYRAAFDIRLPTLREIEGAIKKRHDIVHRGGYDIDHNPIYVTNEEIGALGDTVIAFATEIASLINASRDTGKDLDASGLPEF